ncbi:venom carboxylesterase-6-like [Adelges cooleyi]|uniref:venom carboxylesterase-6-like n=1 Tax=Adelges cooleyi TaxID=133065 RepID=UPI00218028B5|nr:venom carboxylesterase-6-like [Adelges cooleyi]
MRLLFGWTLTTVVVLLSCNLSCVQAFDQVPVVEIDSGLVSGKVSKTWTGRTVFGFEGIPYAAPPIGPLRFQEAQPLKPWLGIWNASTPGSSCIQYSHETYDIEGDEDCLYLNVYTPRLPDQDDLLQGRLLDVLVFIHGGAFMFLEGSSFKPDFLLDKDILLVTLNYRLGPIGFFSTGDAVAPGNNGLKDQVQALKWLKRNVNRFGGNPDKVTISGMSAGGASVHYHMLSPLSRGLFSKAFSQSGSALCPWTITEDVPAKSATIGAYLGCPTKPSSVLVECLSSRPARKIVEAVKLFMPFMYNPYSPFGPVVEPPDSEIPFLSELPYRILAKGEAADVPWLSSVATHEGLYPGSEYVNNEALLNHIDKNWNQVIPHILDYNYTVPSSRIDEVSQRIRIEYMGEQPLVKGKTAEFIQMIGDRLFVVDIVKAAQIQAQVGTSPVYMYQFAYRGRHSLSELFSHSTENYGASHADDTAYALRTKIINVEESEEDRSLVPIMVEIWTSFTKTGKPSTGDSSIEWDPLSKDLNETTVPYLKIASPKNIYMEYGEEMGRKSFWDSLGFNENEQYNFYMGHVCSEDEFCYTIS